MIQSGLLHTKYVNNRRRKLYASAVSEVMTPSEIFGEEIPAGAAPQPRAPAYFPEDSSQTLTLRLRRLEILKELKDANFALLASQRRDEALQRSGADASGGVGNAPPEAASAASGSSSSSSSGAQAAPAAAAENVSSQHQRLIEMQRSPTSNAQLGEMPPVLQGRWTPVEQGRWTQVDAFRGRGPISFWEEGAAVATNRLPAVDAARTGVVGGGLLLVDDPQQNQPGLERNSTPPSAKSAAAMLPAAKNGGGMQPPLRPDGGGTIAAAIHALASGPPPPPPSPPPPAVSKAPAQATPRGRSRQRRQQPGFRIELGSLVPEDEQRATSPESRGAAAAAAPPLASPGAPSDIESVSDAAPADASLGTEYSDAVAEDGASQPDQFMEEASQLSQSLESQYLPSSKRKRRRMRRQWQPAGTPQQAIATGTSASSSSSPITGRILFGDGDEADLDTPLNLGARRRHCLGSAVTGLMAPFRRISAESSAAAASSSAPEQVPCDVL